MIVYETSISFRKGENMNNFDKYFEERIIFIENYRKIVGDKGVESLTKLFNEVKISFDFENSTLYELKLKIKNKLVQYMDLKKIEDKKKRFRFLMIIHNLADFKYENPNSIEALNDICDDLGMSKTEYILVGAKIALNTKKHNEDKEKAK